MPGSLLDLFATLTGRPDPQMQLAAALGQAPGQPGSNTGPIPGAPPGARAGPGAGPPPAPPQGGGPPAGPPGAPAAPPQPQAYQSPPDLQGQYNQLATPNLGQLMMQMYQRQQANEMFNRGLAGMAASMAPPWENRATILRMGEGLSGPDPGELMGNLMKVQQWQQQQAQLQAFQQSAPDIAKHFSAMGIPMTTQEVLGMGPEAARLAIQYGAPPEVARLYDYFGNKSVSEHAGDLGADGKPIGADAARRQFEADNPPGIFMAASMPGAQFNPVRIQRMQAAQEWAKKPENQGKPLPDYFGDDDSFRAHTTQVQQRTEAQTQAGTQFSSLNTKLNNYIGNVADVANDSGLPNLVGSHANQILASTTGIPGALHGKITSLQTLSDVLGKQGGPLTSGSLSGLGPAAADLTKYGLSEDDYRANILAPLMKQALTAQANNYGAAGRTDEMPGYLKAYLDQIYQPGGDLYARSAAGPKRITPNPKLKQMSPPDATNFQTMVEEYGPQKAIQLFKAQHFDMAPME